MTCGAGHRPAPRPRSAAATLLFLGALPGALDAKLDVTIRMDEARLSFVPHAAVNTMPSGCRHRQTRHGGTYDSAAVVPDSAVRCLGYDTLMPYSWISPSRPPV